MKTMIMVNWFVLFGSLVALCLVFIDYDNGTKTLTNVLLNDLTYPIEYQFVIIMGLIVSSLMFIIHDRRSGLTKTNREMT